MKGPILGRVVAVPDAGGRAYRVEVNGNPIRFCAWCGLNAWPRAAAEHARTHGVRVENPEAPDASTDVRGPGCRAGLERETR